MNNNFLSKAIFIVQALFFASQYCRPKNSEGDVKIYRLDTLNETYSLGGDKEGIIRRNECFLVQGDVDDTSFLHKKINEFVLINTEKEPGRFSDYRMIFYKADYAITLEKINNNPDLILRQRWPNEDPLLCIYEWFKGKLLSISYFRKGFEVLDIKPK
jgi:hypothetical protein